MPTNNSSTIERWVYALLSQSKLETIHDLEKARETTFTKEELEQRIQQLTQEAQEKQVLTKQLSEVQASLTTLKGEIEKLQSAEAEQRDPNSVGGLTRGMIAHNRGSRPSPWLSWSFLKTKLEAKDPLALQVLQDKDGSEGCSVTITVNGDAIAFHIKSSGEVTPSSSTPSSVFTHLFEYPDTGPLYGWRSLAPLAVMKALRSRKLAQDHLNSLVSQGTIAPIDSFRLHQLAASCYVTTQSTSDNKWMILTIPPDFPYRPSTVSFTEVNLLKTRDILEIRHSSTDKNAYQYHLGPDKSTDGPALRYLNGTLPRELYFVDEPERLVLEQVQIFRGGSCPWLHAEVGSSSLSIGPIASLQPMYWSYNGYLKLYEERQYRNPAVKRSRET
eukprot:PhF_6_TR9904/c0_g1_i1/m.15098